MKITVKKLNMTHTTLSIVLGVWAYIKESPVTETQAKK